MKRSTCSAEVPAKLRPGDLLMATFKQRNLKWTVKFVDDGPDDTQRVVASFPGQGAVRLTWLGRGVKYGYGHGMKFYFQKRDALVEM